MSDKNNFGKYLAELRVEKGFSSQRSLAIAIGSSNATIARIERGEVEANEKTLYRIAEALGVSYMDLLEKQLAGSDKENELLFAKIGKLNKAQLDIINSMVDQFLKKGEGV